MGMDKNAEAKTDQSPYFCTRCKKEHRYNISTGKFQMHRLFAVGEKYEIK